MCPSSGTRPARKSLRHSRACTTRYAQNCGAAKAVEAGFTLGVLRGRVRTRAERPAWLCVICAKGAGAAIVVYDITRESSFEVGGLPLLCAKLGLLRWHTHGTPFALLESRSRGSDCFHDARPLCHIHWKQPTTSRGQRVQTWIDELKTRAPKKIVIAVAGAQSEVDGDSIAAVRELSRVIPVSGQATSATWRPSVKWTRRKRGVTPRLKGRSSWRRPQR